MVQTLAIDEQSIRSLPIGKRLASLNDILKNNNDESVRWDAVWLLGEIVAQLNSEDRFFKKVSDLCAYVLRHDDNIIVRHEICYQIAGRNMREKIPDLAWSALNDPSDLVRHEATECLGIIHADDEIETIKKATKDPSQTVRDTAFFVLKRMKRTNGIEFNPSTTSF